MRCGVFADIPGNRVQWSDGKLDALLNDSDDDEPSRPAPVRSAWGRVQQGAGGREREIRGGSSWPIFFVAVALLMKPSVCRRDD